MVFLSQLLNNSVPYWDMETGKFFQHPILINTTRRTPRHFYVQGFGASPPAGCSPGKAKVVATSLRLSLSFSVFTVDILSNKVMPKSSKSFFISQPNSVVMHNLSDDTIRYDKRWYIYVRSKADGRANLI